MQENIQPAQGSSFYPQFNDHQIRFPLPRPKQGPRCAERRKARRYQVRGHLLSVCDYYAGQILDISRTGLSFKIVHFLSQADGKVCCMEPRQSDKLDILSPGLSGYFFRDMRVQTVWDLNLGQLYQENKDIIAYRRSVLLASPLEDKQFAKLQRYLLDGLNDKNVVAADVLM